MIFTLCGSARFEPWFHTWNRALSLAGHCVFTLSGFKSMYPTESGEYTDEQKRKLDLVHFNKIVISDAILVLNVFAYIGESTMNEIEYAKMHKKRIYFLESWGQGLGISNTHYECIQSAKAKYIGEKFYGSPMDTFPNYERKQIWDDGILGDGGAYRTSIVNFIYRRNKELTGHSDGDSAS